MNRPMSVKELHGILTMYGWVPLRQKGSHVVYGNGSARMCLNQHRGLRGEFPWKVAKKIIAQAKGEHVNKP